MIDFFSRLDKYMKYNNLNDNKISVQANISNGLIGKARVRGTLSQKNISKILHTYADLNANWLLTGRGAMLLENNKAGVNELKIASDVMPTLSQNKGVPYYNIDFIGQFHLILHNQTMKPNFYIDFEPFNKDSDYWVNTSGDSMEPIISQGDIVVLRKLENWQDFILFGEIYAIITEYFGTIKIINKGKDKEHLSLIPFNKCDKFSKQDIPKRLIKKIFKVKGSIKKFF